jgi:hypothetical protein
VVENCLIHELPELFTPITVQDLALDDTALLEVLAGEPELNATRRVHLQEERKDLEEAIKKIRDANLGRLVNRSVNSPYTPNSKNVLSGHHTPMSTSLELREDQLKIPVTDFASPTHSSSHSASSSATNITRPSPGLSPTPLSKKMHTTVQSPAHNHDLLQPAPEIL